MKSKIILIIIVIVIFSFITCVFLYKFNSIIINNNNSTMNTPIPTYIPDNNTNLTYPPNDYVINNINWSKYPNLKQGYIVTVYIAGPNEVIPYKFIEVQIGTEFVNTEDDTIIKEQLAGVAKEAKKIYGPNSGINIIGTKNGVACKFVSILPNEDEIYK